MSRSKKKRAKDPERTVEERIALRKRRWALGAHILLQVLVVVGALGGPWYRAYVGGEPFPNEEDCVVSGPEFSARWGDGPTLDLTCAQCGHAWEASARVTDELTACEECGDLQAVDLPEPPFWERPGFLAHTALFAAIGAFFFASYDLVADADIQAPILVASVVVAVAAGGFAAALEGPRGTLEEVVEEVEAAGLQARLAEVQAAGAAAVTSGAAATSDPDSDSDSDEDPLERLLPGIRLGWGSALLLSAAPFMLVVSIYLTFIAERAPHP